MRRVHCSTTGGYHTLFRGVILRLFPGSKKTFQKSKLVTGSEFLKHRKPSALPEVIRRNVQ